MLQVHVASGSGSSSLLQSTIKDLRQEVFLCRKIIGFLYIDTFLLSALIGAFLYIASQKLYQYMKNKNGGHAHFPFEKAVFPVVLLFAASVILTYYPL